MTDPDGMTIQTCKDVCAQEGDNDPERLTQYKQSEPYSWCNFSDLPFESVDY